MVMTVRKAACSGGCLLWMPSRARISRRLGMTKPRQRRRRIRTSGNCRESRPLIGHKVRSPLLLNLRINRARLTLLAQAARSTRQARQRRLCRRHRSYVSCSRVVEDCLENPAVRSDKLVGRGRRGKRRPWPLLEGRRWAHRRLGRVLQESGTRTKQHLRENPKIGLVGARPSNLERIKSCGATISLAIIEGSLARRQRNREPIPLPLQIWAEQTQVAASRI